MNKQEIRSLLSLYRTGELDANDARFEEARKQAESDPELAGWWAKEKQIDEIIGAKLQRVPVPAGLRSRLLRVDHPLVPVDRTWGRKLALAGAALVALAVLFSSWRGVFQPAVTLAEYRDEMVSFIKVDPSLELETSDPARIASYLEKPGAPGRLEIPRELQKMEPAGCRTLRFRGHDVSLICFKRGGGKFMHLFVVDQDAFPDLRKGEARDFQQQGAWMTATWTDGARAYLVAIEGDRAALEKCLSTS